MFWIIFVKIKAIGNYSYFHSCTENSFINHKSIGLDLNICYLISEYYILIYVQDMILNNRFWSRNFNRQSDVLCNVNVTFKPELEKYLMKNNFISVLKSSWHQLLDSGIKNRIFHFFKSMYPWRHHSIDEIFLNL